MKISKAEAASSDELMKRICFLKTSKLKYENAKVMQESLDKRLNILVHGMKEDNDNGKKTTEISKNLKNFYKRA